MRDWLRELFEDGFWSGVRYLLYYSWLYPRLMRFVHRHGWHHMPASYLPDGVLHKCHWCGATHFVPDFFADDIQAKMVQPITPVPTGR